MVGADHYFSILDSDDIDHFMKTRDYIMLAVIFLHDCLQFHGIHSEVTPSIPRSSAMITAAFSPIAIAVL